jgi:hypothetical protein
MIALCCGVNFLITSTKYFNEYLEKTLLLTPSVEFSLAYKKHIYNKQKLVAEATGCTKTTGHMHFRL